MPQHWSRLLHYMATLHVVLEGCCKLGHPASCMETLLACIPDDTLHFLTVNSLRSDNVMPTHQDIFTQLLLEIQALPLYEVVRQALVRRVERGADQAAAEDALREAQPQSPAEAMSHRFGKCTTCADLDHLSQVCACAPCHPTCHLTAHPKAASTPESYQKWMR